MHDVADAPICLEVLVLLIELKCAPLIGVIAVLEPSIFCRPPPMRLLRVIAVVWTTEVRRTMCLCSASTHEVGGKSVKIRIVARAQQGDRIGSDFPVRTCWAPCEYAFRDSEYDHDNCLHERCMAIRHISHLPFLPSADCTSMRSLTALSISLRTSSTCPKGFCLLILTPIGSLMRLATWPDRVLSTMVGSSRKRSLMSIQMSPRISSNGR